jgi:ABC-type spermidine/putrescine transport system permease subunit I
MKSTGLTLIIGMLVALPLAYFLQIKKPPAFALLILICIGVSIIIRTMVRAFIKEKKEVSK